MDETRARALLAEERARVEGLLEEVTESARENRAAANEQGDMADPAEPLIAEGANDAVAEDLTERLEALDRAEERLDDGTFGRSVRSGDLIPDDRLEADPAAELTVDEARALAEEAPELG